MLAELRRLLQHALQVLQNANTKKETHHTVRDETGTSGTTGASDAHRAAESFVVSVRFGTKYPVDKLLRIDLAVLVRVYDGKEAVYSIGLPGRRIEGHQDPPHLGSLEHTVPVLVEAPEGLQHPLLPLLLPAAERAGRLGGGQPALRAGRVEGVSAGWQHPDVLIFLQGAQADSALLVDPCCPSSAGQGSGHVWAERFGLLHTLVKETKQLVVFGCNVPAHEVADLRGGQRALAPGRGARPPAWANPATRSALTAIASPGRRGFPLPAVEVDPQEP